MVFIHEVPLRTTVALKPATDPTADAALATTRLPVPAPQGDRAALLVDESAEPSNDQLAQTRAEREPVRVMNGGEVPTAAVLQPERLIEAQLQGSDPDVDLASLDDPTQRQAVAALDVLTAAQDRARQHLAASKSAPVMVNGRIDEVGRAVDQAVARFHAEIDQIKRGLLEVDPSASLGRDGTGGDSLRSTSTDCC